MSSMPIVPNNTGDDFPMFARIHDVPPGTDAPAPMMPATLPVKLRGHLPRKPRRPGEADEVEAP